MIIFNQTVNHILLNAPAKYAEPDTSGITTTIKKGKNTFDIVIAK